uniref:Uncharacterized protein n=1 Tax=Chromera velia CCMP2878 TaxID=1169474 RepID=A0A0G4GBZ0_9ALVE|eukprot:Cvel_21206.t1-p1 / transcript=Cvel_21206.t1 / gene=Cvel_21206 / organism=Chromera_velia_CCMP2878 / gene_product=hypothetical protein / transcript_product=hypothetical protein / location=Cvel_scaffold1969:18495-19102(+) / protein_length=87 / sequence_SO=supercontig / SO=protein_coding / is_pseudo=false
MGRPGALPGVGGVVFLTCLAFSPGILGQGMEMGAVDVIAAFLTSKDHNAERVGMTLPSVLPRVPDKNPFKDIPDDKYEELKRMAAEY